MRDEPRDLPLRTGRARPLPYTPHFKLALGSKEVARNLESAEMLECKLLNHAKQNKDTDTNKYCITCLCEENKTIKIKFSVG
jgi:hypothetical protein